MVVSRKHFNVATIALIALAIAIFPVWPWCHWGYFPSFLIAGIVAFMYALRRLASD
jgi:hypothetical protein